MGASGIKDAGELARFRLISRITAWCWCNGRTAPDFAKSLRIWWTFGLSESGILF
jgi:hypothetical protein